MKPEIESMQQELRAAVADIGGMATNLAEAADWAGDDRAEEAMLSLEAVSAGTEDAVARLRAVALKCEEICSRKAVRK